MKSSMPMFRRFCDRFWLLPFVTHVIILVLVSVLGIVYIHANQELTSTFFAVVLFKADVATDSACALAPATPDAL